MRLSHWQRVTVQGDVISVKCDGRGSRWHLARLSYCVWAWRSVRSVGCDSVASEMATGWQAMNFTRTPQVNTLLPEYVPTNGVRLLFFHLIIMVDPGPDFGMSIVGKCCKVYDVEWAWLTKDGCKIFRIYVS